MIEGMEIRLFCKLMYSYTCYISCLALQMFWGKDANRLNRPGYMKILEHCFYYLGLLRQLKLFIC